MRKSNAPPTILERIKADPEVKYLLGLAGGRHLFECPRTRIGENATINKVRFQHPSNCDVLTSAMKRDDGQPLNPISVFVQEHEGELLYQILDGRQRFRASTADRFLVQWLERWTDEKAALADATSLNFARFEVGEADIISILSTEMLTIKEVCEHTGQSESTVQRLAKVAKHPWLWNPIKEGVIGVSVANKLIKAANSNREKLDALQNTFSELYRANAATANAWQHTINTNKSRKYEPGQGPRQDLFQGR